RGLAVALRVCSGRGLCPRKCAGQKEYRETRKNRPLFEMHSNRCHAAILLFGGIWLGDNGATAMPNRPKKQRTFHGSITCGKVQKRGTGRTGGNTTSRGKFCYAGNTRQENTQLIRKIRGSLVRSSGFEPPRYCYRQPLKLVRLPVPPRPHRGKD